MTSDPSSKAPPRRPRILLIAHHDAPLDTIGLRRWIGSFAELAGTVIIAEPSDAVKRRVQREFNRLGPLRFADVLAFRLYYKLALASDDTAWTTAEARRLEVRYPDVDAPRLEVTSPNIPAAEAFIQAAAPDIIIARSKFMLADRIFKLARRATLVMHPGICPEYRNAHGCFWALAHGDVTRVGLTLLAVDAGIDTGPVYGYYSYAFDEATESHYRIQQRCLFENLDPIATKIIEIDRGTAMPIDTRGRKSAVWGQPWLTKQLAWQRRARGKQT